MTSQPSADDRQDESFRPDRGWPAGQRWPEDEDWPPDEDWPDDDPLGIPWAGEEIQPAPGQGSGPGPRRRRGALGLAAVAVLAAAAGAALAWPFTGTNHGSPATGTGSSPGSAAPGGSPGAGAPGSSPGATVPGGPGGIITGPGGGSGGGPGSGPVIQMLITGTVKAVSALSITIGAPGQPVTAAVTSSTRVTGRVTSIGSIAVGDQVSAQIIRSGGKTIALAIQDPAVSVGIP